MRFLERLQMFVLLDALDRKNNAKNYHEQYSSRKHELVGLHDYSPLFSGCMHTDTTTNKTNTNALEKRQIAGNSLKNTLAKPTIKTPFARSAVSLAINSRRFSLIAIINLSLSFDRAIVKQVLEGRSLSSLSTLLKTCF